MQYLYENSQNVKLEIILKGMISCSQLSKIKSDNPTHLSIQHGYPLLNTFYILTLIFSLPGIEYKVRHIFPMSVTFVIYRNCHFVRKQQKISRFETWISTICINMIERTELPNMIQKCYVSNS